MPGPRAPARHAAHRAEPVRRRGSARSGSRRLTAGEVQSRRRRAAGPITTKGTRSRQHEGRRRTDERGRAHMPGPAGPGMCTRKKRGMAGAGTTSTVRSSGPVPDPVSTETPERSPGPTACSARSPRCEAASTAGPGATRAVRRAGRRRRGWKQGPRDQRHERRKRGGGGGDDDDGLRPDGGCSRHPAGSAPAGGAVLPRRGGSWPAKRWFSVSLLASRYAWVGPAIGRPLRAVVIAPLAPGAVRLGVVPAIALRRTDNRQKSVGQRRKDRGGHDGGRGRMPAAAANRHGPPGADAGKEPTRTHERRVQWKTRLNGLGWGSWC